MVCNPLQKAIKRLKYLYGLMNLPPPPTKSERYNEVLGSVVEDVCFKSTDNAVKEAVSCNDELSDSLLQ